MKVNLIPMSGAGIRYSKVGFKLPKPLIPVSSMPMILKSVRDMPAADKWIFIVRKEHVEQYKIDALLRENVKNCEIIVDPEPHGQLTTCLLAWDMIDPNDTLLVGSCDNGYLFNDDVYNKLCADKTVDAVVWTFTKRNALRDSPASWGWCALESDGLTIKEVKVKIPVTADPYNDHAVTATFLFKKAADFFAGAEMLMASGEKVNGEFYVDALPNFLKKMGKRSVIFDVDLYVGWGRPEDLSEYEAIEKICKSGEKTLSEEQKLLMPLWQKYFKR